jgi:hypothetical protein
MSSFFETLEDRTLYSTTVGIATLNPQAYEQGQQSASFIVYRSDRLSTPTRVYFSVGGTATSPVSGALSKFVDYTGITAPPPIITTLGTSFVTPRLATIFTGGNTGYVDIPAGDTFATVTITPKDDSFAEGRETAIFTLKSNPNYAIGTSNSVTMYIHDNDGPFVAKDVQDAYIRDGNSSDTNFGHATELQVKKSTTGLNRASYVQFDLSNIDALGTYNTIKLKLYGSLNNSNQHNVPVSVLEGGTIDWSETAITWTHHPVILVRLGENPQVGTITVTDTTPRWYTLDVTDYVKGLMKAGATKVTFLLKDDSVSDPYVRFNSREAASNRPQLVFNG